MKRKNKKMKGGIQAGAPLTQFRLDCEPSEVEFAAAVVDGDSPRLPRFKMLAYTGGPILKWGEVYVIDLAGMSIPETGIPVRMHHEADQGVGHTEKIEAKNGRRLLIEGIVSRDTEAAREVVASAKQGFPWQASVGIQIQGSESVAEKVLVTVNGRKFTGPLFVFRKTSLEEVSFVDRGADGNTSARVAAMADRRGAMICELCKSETCDGSCANDDVRTSEPKKVEASGGGDSLEDTGVSVPVPKASPKVPSPEAVPQLEAAADVIAEMETKMRTATVAESKRIADIQEICAGECRELEAKAISGGWTLERCELEKLRTLRPKPVATHIDRTPVTGKVLEAAVVLSAKHPKVEEKYDEETLDRADKRFRGGIGLQELLLEAAWANGYTGRSFRDMRGVLRAAMGGSQFQAGVSLIDLPGILGAVANTFLLEGFFSVEQVWRAISSRRSVTNFQTVTSYRLIGKDQYELVAPGGEIKHGTLGEETYTNKADTYGLILNIDRRDIINDDLGALTTVPRKQGRGAGLKINDIFWTVFMDNSSFFTAGNNNYIVDFPLAIAGLTTGEQTFMDQVDGDSKPTGIEPKILLVPTALMAIGSQLFSSMEMREYGTGASVRYPTANPHANKFPVHVSRYLGNTAYTGASSLAWYLLADPQDLSTIEVAFLNGQESPTIESADADFNTLGISLRGYHDFGVAKQDPKAGMKSKGEA